MNVTMGRNGYDRYDRNKRMHSGQSIGQYHRSSEGNE